MKTVLSKLRAGFVRPQGGIALPITVSVLLIAGLLAAAAAVAATTSLRQSTRDRSVKRTVEGADAGLEIAANRLNRFATVLTDSLPCVVVGGSGTLTTEAAQNDGWCRAQTENLDDGSTYTYRVSARQQMSISGANRWVRKIVSTGTVNGVQRRAFTAVSAAVGNPGFRYGVFSDLDINLYNSAYVTATVRTNNDATTSNSAAFCGDVIIGPGHEFNAQGVCGSTQSKASDTMTLEPVNVPPGNDNLRITNGTDPRSGTVTWSSSNRTLTIDGGTLTLRGSNYLFCSLHLTNGARLIVEDDGTPVKIYIDAPENCTTGDPSRGSVHFEKKGRIDNAGPAAMAQVWMVGSNTISTSFTFDNNEKQAVKIVIYAPRSNFSMQNYGYLIGAVAAKQVTMRNSTEILYDSSAASVLNTPTQTYTREAWVECRPVATGTAPDSGC
jgi:Tfp pilus assembly protein PilX